jgi:phosphoglycerate dehydrogenase-like enzyme
MPSKTGQRIDTLATQGALSMTQALFLLDPEPYDLIYSPAERVELSKLAEFYAPLQTRLSVKENPVVLSEAEVIFSGWGMALMDEAFLTAAPNLKAVFYGAGSIRYFMTEAAWQRGITVVSAYYANDIPVVEYTLSQILFSLKLGWRYVFDVKRLRAYPPRLAGPGCYGSMVGLISLGMIGRMVAERLKTFELKVIAYDPYISQAQADPLGVRMCSLEEVFQVADVVSLHTPWLPETEGLVTGELLRMMKPYATFINTARGAVVCENEMIAVLQERPDLTAVLDVTYPEPPEEGSLLYTLPNVILTPHIAGAMGHECWRMGRLMAEEFRRYLKGEPLKWAISKE